MIVLILVVLQSKECHLGLFKCSSLGFKPHVGVHLFIYIFNIILCRQMSVNRLMFQSPSDRHVLSLTSFLPMTLILEINVVTTCTARSNLKESYILLIESTYGFCMSLRTKTVIASLNSNS